MELHATSTMPWLAISVSVSVYCEGVVVMPLPQTAIGCFKPFAPSIVSGRNNV